MLLFLLVPIIQVNAITAIIDGDLIKTSDNFDVYIVRQVPSTGSGQVEKYKRLILNPEIFNQYGHLKWGNIKIVSQTEMDEYIVSDLVRSVGDDKVYKLYPNGDMGEKRWIKTADDFSGFGYKINAIYEINSFEHNYYTEGTFLTIPTSPTPPTSPTSPITPIIPTSPTSRTSPTTLYVPADYTTIQSALDASISGDTISVSKGTYKENITINKGVKLIGESAGYVNLDGQGIGPTIIINGVDDFLIQKFTITSENQKAIYCKGADKTKGTIKNIYLKNSLWGIYAEDNCELTILNNIIYNNRSSDAKSGGGIFIKNNLSYSLVSEIRNNTIDDNNQGIYVENSAIKSLNNIISSNFGSAMSIGIYLNGGTVNNSYSNFWKNGQDLYGGAGTGDGGLFLDPKFVNVRERNYHLIWGSGDSISPCINTGHPSMDYNDGKLLTGVIYRNDMGAYGGPDNIGWE